MPESKQDRELIELLNELRVALPGVQVMFAFLLMVPFSQGWALTTATQKGVYYAAFVFSTLAILMLISPTTYHRIRFRDRDKEHLIKLSNRLAIAGTVFLATAMSCVVYFVTDYTFPNITAVATGILAGLFAWFWFGLPILREIREPSAKTS
ncbi:MAG TPA: DUF6328 family protein [Actinomycetota bacterium]|nr:DUF6328 family protein [Actinomycetota bacterium]